MQADPPVDDLIENLLKSRRSFKGVKNLKIVRTLFPIFLERGEPGTEELLMDAFRLDTANLFILESYLSCGNTTLASYARSWALEHGYTIGGTKKATGVYEWGRARRY